MEPRATNITWHAGAVSGEDRARLLGHRGAVVWFTGLSGSGKSTVARKVEERLFERRALAYVLDGDNLRHGLCVDLGFGPEDRGENMRRAGEAAKLLADAGAITLCALVSPFRADRDRIRARFERGAFFEVYVAAPIEVCEARDPKGLYVKARAGAIPEFTGVSAPYEEPLSPELVVETHVLDLDACAARVIELLERAGVFGA
jgi:adenylylsulfate kinase